MLESNVGKFDIYYYLHDIDINNLNDVMYMEGIQVCIYEKMDIQFINTPGNTILDLTLKCRDRNSSRVV